MIQANADKIWYAFAKVACQVARGKENHGVLLQAYHKKHRENPPKPPRPPLESTRPLINSHPGLELELVRELALRQTEARSEVLVEVLGLLDRGNDCRINRLLVRSLRLWESLLRLRLAISKEFFLR
jgi:hypothetical protein